MIKNCKKLISEDFEKYKGLLQEKEEIIWSGKPKSGFRLRLSDVFLLPLSVLWGASVTPNLIEQMLESIDSPGGLVLILADIFFLLLTFFLMFGRFFYNAYQRNRTFYCLTSKRAIIFSGIFRRKINTINLKNITEITLSEKFDGSGDITFYLARQNDMLHQFTKLLEMSGYNYSPTLELIPNAREVYQNIQIGQCEADN